MAIKTACTYCEKPFTLANDMRGKTIRCDDCGESFVVKGPVDHPDGLMTSEDRPRLHSPEIARAGDDAEDRPRQAVPRSESSGLIIGLCAGGALLVIGGVVLAVVLLTGGSGGPTPDKVQNGTAPIQTDNALNDKSPGPTSENRITPDNVRKVRKGMLEKELTDILGNPTFTEITLGGGKNMSYINPTTEVEVLIVFVVGKANAITGKLNGNPNLDFFDSNTRNGPLTPNQNPRKLDPRFTVENVQKLRKGMTEQQVLATLGPPTTTIEPPQGTSGPKQLAYIGDAVQVTVWFNNGKAEMLTGFVEGQFVNTSAFNPNATATPNPGSNGIDPSKLQQNMTEEQVTSQFGQPLSATDVPGQLAANKGVNPADARLADGQFKPIKAFLYNRRDGQPGTVEVILVDGRVYRYNLYK
jgi:hypothetical protein